MMEGMGTAGVLLLTGLWHMLAAWHFTVFPARTLARTTAERPVSRQSTELFRFLGGLNLALAVLAGASMWQPQAQRWPALLALAVANLSQYLVDVRVLTQGMVHGPFFKQILWGDALFACANAAALAFVASAA